MFRSILRHKNKRDEKIELGFKNLCTALKIVVMSHRFVPVVLSDVPPFLIPSHV